MPTAVHDVGTVELKDGTTINDFKVVNERTLLLENVGATQQLHKNVFGVDRRVSHLEDRLDPRKKNIYLTIGIISLLVVTFISVITAFIVLSRRNPESELLGCDGMQQFN